MELQGLAARHRFLKSLSTNRAHRQLLQEWHQSAELGSRQPMQLGILTKILKLQMTEQCRHSIAAPQTFTQAPRPLPARETTLQHSHLEMHHVRNCTVYGLRKNTVCGGQAVTLPDDWSGRAPLMPRVRLGTGLFRVTVVTTCAPHGPLSCSHVLFLMPISWLQGLQTISPAPCASPNPQVLLTCSRPAFALAPGK